MTRTRLLRQASLFAIPILLIGTTTGLAQSNTRNGILKIHVKPKQAYACFGAKAKRAVEVVRQAPRFVEALNVWSVEQAWPAPAV
jgi:hypothetical protein